MARHRLARQRVKGALVDVVDRVDLDRKKAVTAVVAAGALIGAGFTQAMATVTPMDRIVPVAATKDLAAAMTAQPEKGPQTVRALYTVSETRKLIQAEQIQAQFNVKEAIRVAEGAFVQRQEAAQAEAARVAAEQEAERARVAAEEEARRPQCVKPAEGTFTSGFGARWGTSHNGVDIANAIGTPIVAAMEGTVIEAGPASGFGLWVRVQHADGTVTVYGHMNTIDVAQGAHVKAGQQIATIGNRGQSTGPHLHFEVWLGGSQKVNPVGWLAERGVSL
ncbi:Murein DD-endopeptidase MepM and murein hydrolase activator NlpD, contain LysM domain [Lentzea fradiae]|uniref:Murein DD-endopeptidase MepM and murein hydrolase activator NlpD, contain LysM domain n=1 Tax=Lentzea fradiae TaxID=200378 RepID=A0A1G7ZI07_9PSEU|nr:M23 family metallopeptidase [Lentzea fradiae]SDH08186.1 Murein DD-endopeptidase MepM and murein hydrolase activator NlpD, contain LysM domain [Lentzea fradiae]